MQNFALNGPEWAASLNTAESLVPIIGRLYRSNGILLSVHGRPLINRTAIDLLKAMRFARHRDGETLDINRVAELVRTIDSLQLPSAEINVAAMLAKQAASGKSIEAFASEELNAIEPSDDSARDVVLYGFGRIGRQVARILLAQDAGNRGLKVRAIVVRNGGKDDLAKRASLLRRDSVHGMFDGIITVDADSNSIIANGNQIKVIYSNDPSTVDYEAHGIHNALVIDNTGKWRDEAGLTQHLSSKGAAKVLLTAPGKGSLPNVVFGINQNDFDATTKIVSAASCTTNAVVPVLKVLNDAFGVKHGHVETVHSFTNDQNLIDNFHSGDRRGRSAVLNMVITETGAAQAAAKALPALAGKLTGSSIRVPTPDVSMAILNLNFDKEVSIESLNKVLRDAALDPVTRDQIDYIESPEVVSTDLVGSTHAGVVDSLATQGGGNNGVVYVWYDNENGYSNQVVRIAQKMMLVERPVYPR
ncbi:glyceraldehyde-3-phosphate dehydrogenase [Rhodoluna sp.]|uniref:glyceraldehyde-3-phosphate dehydrogenase n=1 Tax=Rhodoluna sp. TaxID=1969481 RepID=UPI0025CE6C89|nr:glyceraldehyde-3-phosphate dehydrogenase [Rhodoluna sp.]